MVYRWPGNVRELQNVIRRIIVLGEGEGNLDKMINLSNDSRHNNVEPNFTNDLGLNGKRIDLTDFSFKKFKKQASDQVERKVISYVLEKTDWHRGKACKILKVSYKTLIDKIQNLELRPRDEFV